MNKHKQTNLIYAILAVNYFNNENISINNAPMLNKVELVIILKFFSEV